jgi:CHAT domain-containing protein
VTIPTTRNGQVPHNGNNRLLEELAMLRGAALTSLVLLLSGSGAASAQVAAGGLGTRVNGTALGRCSVGICSVQGGSAAGPNLFHRFSQFDTRAGIQRVDLDSRGRSNVVVGVSNPAGSFFGAPLRLSGAANLFWLSPGGLWLGNGARFQGATSLLLSTAPSLRIGGGAFDALGGLADRLGAGADAPSLDIEALANGSGAIVLAGGRLTVDRHLLLHSGAGAILTAPGERNALRAGGSVQLSGGNLQLRGLDLQAGNGADDRLLLRSGALMEGGLGRLELADATLRGAQVRLEGAGGLALERVEARAEGPTGAGPLQLSAGLVGRPAPTRLAAVSLSGGDVLVRASGPLAATDLRAQAGADGGGGQLELAAGAPTAGEPSLRLERAELQGRNVILRADGPGNLRQVAAHAGQAEQPGGLWLSTRPGPGGAASPLDLQTVRLSGSTVLAQAAGDLQARDLNIQADQLWLRAEGAASNLIGRELNVEGGTLDLAAGRSLALQRTTLEGQTIVARADQSLTLTDLTAVAGSPGQRGVILLDGTGEASLVGARLEGQRVVVRGDAIRLGENSRIAAPKGMIQLEARRGDLTISASHLDVGVDNEADLRTPVNLLAGTGTNDSRRNTPNIALLAERNLTIGEGSSLRATQDLGPLRAANPALRDADMRLTDTSGIVLADAGQGLLVSDSRIEADASDNLAGYLLLRAQARDGRGELVLRNASLSASGGAGSGDIRLNSANGMRIEDSQLIARSPNSPADAFHPGDPDWSKLFTGSFSGGEITLTNSASQTPITIINSQLKAEQSAGGGSLLPTRSFEGAREGAELFDSFDSNDSGFPNYSGGILSLLSQGGITISGARTLLSVSSLAEAANAPEDFGGILRLINTSQQPLLISDSARLEAQTGAAFHPLSSDYTAAGVINLWNRGPISLVDSSLNNATLLEPDQPWSSFYQGSIAIHSASEITIQRSALSYGPGPSDLPGLGELVLHSPSSPAILESTLLPGCGGICGPRPWDSQAFDDFLHPSGVGPSVWGAFFRAPNPYLLPVGDRVRDQLFDGGPQYSRPLPTSVRGWIDSTPTRTVFQPGAPARRLEDLLAPDSGPLPETWLRNPVTATTVPAAPLSPSWMASADTTGLIPDLDPRLAINFSAGSENAPNALLLDGSESIPETGATAAFQAADQSASREVIGALGLRQPLPQSPTIGALQQLLRQSRPAAAATGLSTPLLSGYAPAILQISSSPVPGQPLLLINHVLIPAVGEIRGWQTRVPRDLLQQGIQAFQRQLSQQGDLADSTAGRQLASLLIDPVLPELQRQGINALLLALDRGLQGIPFAALPAAGGSLVDRFALTITPALALTDLAPATSTPPRRRTLLAGASRFPNGLMPLLMAEQELRRLAALHPDALVLLDAAFQSRTLIEKSRERPVDILHLATHADFASQRADGARIYTSDGTLSLTELGRQLRNGQAEPMSLFVLNACRTAVGNEDRELGIAGLALQAGASSAMGNLWFVDDVVAAAFSVQFHHALEQGLSKDQALQQTQQRFRQGRIRVQGDQIVNENQETLISGLNPADQARLGSDLRHPYFWAGMVLTGRPW